AVVNPGTCASAPPHVTTHVGRSDGNDELRQMWRRLGAPMWAGCRFTVGARRVPRYGKSVRAPSTNEILWAP
ncbi:MAG: hypothetical protein AAF436_09510, partial [Myxococcota bacterium]